MPNVEQFSTLLGDNTAEEEFIKPQEGLEYNGDEDDGANILNGVLAITEKKRFGSRTEFVPEVSQFNVPLDEKVELFELVKGLGKKVQHTALKKQISRVENREKVLDVPLAKHQLEQITRTVQYEKTSKDVSQWEPIVEKNRKAEQLKFPLSQPDLKIHQTISQFVEQQHRPKTTMELEVAAMLKQNQPIVDAVTRPLSKVEEAALKAMSLQEAKLKRAELQRNRMREAFVAAKMRIQGKIKSKKFHKIKRRAQEKDDKKKLELMSTGAEAYQEWVQKAERQRVQERMSLKHKGTSRFMQRQTRYGKFNMANRQAVQDMLQQGQTLRSKVNVSDGANDDGDLTSSDESADDVDESKNTVARHASELNAAKTAESDVDQDEDSEDDRIVETTTRKRTLEDLEEDDDGSVHENLSEKEGQEQLLVDKRPRLDIALKDKKRVKKRKVATMIDPAQFMAVERDLSSASGVDLVISGADGEEGSSFKVAMAFAEDDDVLADFVSEKKNIMERDRPKDIDLRLPGWGDWSGPGIVTSKRRKKRFVIKAPPAPPRKDQELGNVIISEQKDTTLAKHQVNTLPFPYTNVVEFEKRIRQPVGRTWNTVATFKKLVKPKIVSKLGQVIAPIDKSETFKKASFDVKPAQSNGKGRTNQRQSSHMKNDKNSSKKNSFGKKQQKK